jgi:hypothetical protein
MYGLQNMKEFQENMTHQVNGLPVKMVAQFPNFFNYSASIGYYLDYNVIIGLNGSFMSTGGRNSISDYSGVYKLDMLLHAYQLGIESEYICFLNRKWNLHLNFKMGVIKSVLNANEFVNIYNVDSKTEKEYFEQVGAFLEPNFNLSYKIYKGFALKAGVGYNLNTIKLEGGLLDWTGLRPRLGVTYTFAN